jgi:biotin transport system substrate-specific component
MHTKNISRCALAAALICLCAWIAVPVGDTVFTMQTFALFLTLFLLGGKWGMVAIGVYLALGLAGLPVFTGFRGGLGVLLGATGGYIWGFLLCGGVFWLASALGKCLRWQIGGMVLGMICCYAAGTLWYALGYLGGSDMGFGLVLVRCVIPYLIPDGIKLVLAYQLAQRLKRFV